MLPTWPRLTLPYAAASTDDGHSGSSPLWMQNPVQLIDFGSRAVHATALLAKSVIREFYGQCPQQSYFVRCSEGGREALMEAKRFPDDYDGIIVSIRRRPQRAYCDVSGRLSSSGSALWISTNSRSVSMPKSVNAMTPSSPGP